MIARRVMFVGMTIIVLFAWFATATYDDGYSDMNIIFTLTLTLTYLLIMMPIIKREADYVFGRTSE